MGLGATKIGAFTALIPCLPMYFSTWETFHTHTLYLGYFNGPTEGLILACSAMIASGYLGPQLWRTPFASFLDLPESFQDFGEYTLLDAWVPILLFSFFAAHMPGCVYNVATARQAKGLPVAPVFLEWIPMIIYTAATCAWLGSPYSTLLQENHLMLWCLTQSFVFGRLTTKIILAHLTRQPFPYWTVLLTPLIVGAIVVNAPFFGVEVLTAESEYYFLAVYFAFSVVVYFRWAFLVVNAICDYLGINCLTIPADKWEKLKKQQ